MLRMAGLATGSRVPRMLAAWRSAETACFDMTFSLMMSRTHLPQTDQRRFVKFDTPCSLQQASDNAGDGPAEHISVHKRDPSLVADPLPCFYSK